jgi:hypothetical protein
MQIFHLKLYDDHSVLAPNLNLNPRNRMEKRFAESTHAQLRNRCENAQLILAYKAAPLPLDRLVSPRCSYC